MGGIMKFLICGLGSIGKRHLNNLEHLGIPCQDISIFRTRKGASDFGDNVLWQHSHKHPLYDDLAKALAAKPDVALITNPTSLHIPVALAAASAGCHLFIEKPLSHNLDGLNALNQVVQEKGVFAFVAYNRRHHKFLHQIQYWIHTGLIGKVVSVHAEMAERATDWHPWEDYKISYATRQDLGGGVILSQCHEIDYLYWLFGKPQWVFAAGGELGNLGIGVEDTCKSIIGFPNNVMASLHVDYLQRPAKGGLEISGLKGRIVWNYFDRKLSLIPLSGDSIEVLNPPKKPGDSWMTESFVEELMYFLTCLRTGTAPLPGLKEGKDVLEILLALKTSLRTRSVVSL